jgi:hypothetical protein
MKRLLNTAAAIVGFWSAVAAQSSVNTSLQQLYERHSWFELRDAVAGKTVSPLYSGAVASAFNRSADAERHLRRAVREASSAEAATDAREALANLYMRIGRSSDMVRVLDEALAAAPSRSDFRNVLQAFARFRTLPNQTARLGGGRPFSCAVGPKGVSLPAVVNGKPVEWLFDSAFSHSALSESEARMLGISVHGAAATAEDFAAGTASMRTAMAERIAIGDAELRNVPVLVFPDSQPPWDEYAPGKRGTIGLPVILALRSIRWTREQTCGVGFNPIRSARQDLNIAFDGGTPMVRAYISGKPIDLVFDSGNQGGTQLWERFAREFPDVASQGRKSTKRVSQIGGSVEREIVVVPQIRLRIGDFDGLLEPANIFSKPVGNDFQHGNLGVDVMSQAAEVSIDFRAMSLMLR